MPLERNMGLVERGRKCGTAEINDLIENYLVAMRLANGPDPKRAKHWSVEAKERERKLKLAVVSCENIK